MKVTAIFDIGKTNKKFFLFDENYKEVFKEYSRFEEIKDEDGYPCDDLQAIQKWLRTIFKSILKTEKYEVQAINFSSYGASFVHINKAGNPVAPLYNYTKPFPEELRKKFYDRYGPEESFSRQTSSPALGMLNSGLQLYYLKYAKPEIYQQIRYSLHLPQYLSFLFTGIPLSDFTSVGCHTGMWDYKKGDYHDWIYAEGIDHLFPPLVDTTTNINMNYAGKRMNIGVGIHDSSAALLPYLKVDKKPFLLLSTGTWSISLNPYSKELLSDEDLKNDCLHFLRVDGKPVKAARLFLGNEYKLQVEKLHDHFGKDYGYHRTIQFDEKIYQELMADRSKHFHFESINIPREQPAISTYKQFPSFETAFHQLMIELTDLQIQSAKRAMGTTPIRKIYVDGGFADNDIFVKLLSLHFPGIKLRTTQSPLGSSLGAALVLSDKKVSRKFLKKHYALKKHAPLILTN